MENPTRIQSIEKPDKITKLGNGYYYYNYDIKSEKVQVVKGDNVEEVDGYSYIPVYIHGQPNYKDCVTCTIRMFVSANEEFSLINEFNSYQYGQSDTYNDEYLNYLQTVTEIKTKVQEDFEQSASQIVSDIPRQQDMYKLLQITINTMQLSDQESLEVKSLYPEWSTFIGKTVAKDIKLKYDNKLFKVVQEHLVQEQFPPSISTASLYTQIVEDHAGTIEDPIPYPEDGNMIIYNGKYYIENGIIYLCIRDSQQPLYTALANVVNNYVQVV